MRINLNKKFKICIGNYVFSMILLSYFGYNDVLLSLLSQVFDAYLILLFILLMYILYLNYKSLFKKLHKFVGKYILKIYLILNKNGEKLLNNFR